MNELSGMNGMPEKFHFSRFFCSCSIYCALCLSLTVRFSWNLLININVEMVTRIMVFAFVSLTLLALCMLLFLVRMQFCQLMFFSSPFSSNIFWLYVLSLCVCVWCVYERCCYTFFLLLCSFASKNKLTLWHIVHTSFFRVQLYC